MDTNIYKAHPNNIIWTPILYIIVYVYYTCMCSEVQYRYTECMCGPVMM